MVDRDGQGHRACHRDAVRKISRRNENLISSKKFLTKKDFVPIPAELYEHADNVVDVTVELSVVVAMEILRNVRQFHTFEQMVENTFHEPDEGKKKYSL